MIIVLMTMTILNEITFSNHMIFEYEPTSYAQNLAEYAALDEIDFKPADSKDTVINKLSGPFG